MRITQNSMNRTQLMGLENSLGRLQRTQEELTTGKRLTRPSDNPVDTVSAMRLRDQQRGLEQLGRNIDDGLARLRSADDALTRTSAMLNRVRTQVVSAANGTNSQNERNAFAAEVQQLREGILQLANTKYAGASVFAGTQNVDNAFDPATGKWQGNDAPVIRKITEAASPAGDIDVSISGEKAFGGGTADDLLGAGGILDRIVTKLNDPTQGPVADELAKLDSALERLSSAQSTIGARTNRLEGLQQLNGMQDDASKVALSKVEDTDFMKAAMDLAVQSNAYNAALQASAKIIQPSLMDFLR
ncbi:flagellar hook-associated protein 3 FlgL [Austwickia chelonae]|uniref:Flagellar hook-associated protein 3 n=1 Tax=Austwickia chelonae NBRC 105200 TaxID=1184607 RepID=K6VRT0_9MICO|nr:flagellar hook-associated protein FlgL [Austwickia chelonae]GAB79464.1 flagellar hook-associated protein 3 [Austwickia chelonae NBRC 105200]SEV88301.1 flagellar hook-associated protein 3 FlgL [Austwickia chelonae]